MAMSCRQPMRLLAGCPPSCCFPVRRSSQRMEPTATEQMLSSRCGCVSLPYNSQNLWAGKPWSPTAQASEQHIKPAKGTTLIYGQSTDLCNGASPVYSVSLPPSLSLSLSLSPSLSLSLSLPVTVVDDQHETPCHRAQLSSTWLLDTHCEPLDTIGGGTCPGHLKARPREAAGRSGKCCSGRRRSNRSRMRQDRTVKRRRDGMAQRKRNNRVPGSSTNGFKGSGALANRTTASSGTKAPRSPCGTSCRARSKGPRLAMDSPAVCHTVSHGYQCPLCKLVRSLGKISCAATCCGCTSLPLCDIPSDPCLLTGPGTVKSCCVGVF